MGRKQNFLHLYIGGGKGKTTSAVGMAIRAAGRNWSVLFCQFLKSAESGELLIMDGLNDRITVFRPEMRHIAFLWEQTQQQIEETKADLELGWGQICGLIENRSFDMIILDEILDVLHLGLLPESRVLDMIKKYPAEWVLTGRTASEALMNEADYVTRMESVRHPYQKGVTARRGVEY